jgi:hypothetical protein
VLSISKNIVEMMKELFFVGGAVFGLHEVQLAQQS